MKSTAGVTHVDQLTCKFITYSLWRKIIKSTYFSEVERPQLQRLTGSPFYNTSLFSLGTGNQRTLFKTKTLKTKEKVMLSPLYPKSFHNILQILGWNILNQKKSKVIPRFPTPTKFWPH